MSQIKPVVQSLITDSGAKLIRFQDLSDIFWYDEPTNNPHGISMRRNSDEYYTENIDRYKKERLSLTHDKLRILAIAQKELSIDKDFLELVYKAKSDKRKYTMSKFGGNLSMPHYAAQNEKCFKKSTPGAKKVTLDMAFQVGTFSGGDYTGSFVKILKTILMCQALNIRCNIDMFDSDTEAWKGPNREYSSSPGAYVICNVASSDRKLDMREILAASHSEFFNYTLFNGYSANENHGRIGTFLNDRTILRDLKEKYDVIGGNMIPNPEWGDEGGDMISKVFKIAWQK